MRRFIAGAMVLLTVGCATERGSKAGGAVALAGVTLLGATVAQDLDGSRNLPASAETAMMIGGLAAVLCGLAVQYRDSDALRAASSTVAIR